MTKDERGKREVFAIFRVLRLIILLKTELWFKKYVTRSPLKTSRITNIEAFYNQQKSVESVSAILSWNMLLLISRKNGRWRTQLGTAYPILGTTHQIGYVSALRPKFFSNGIEIEDQVQINNMPVKIFWMSFEQWYVSH